ncbi:MAG: acyltransferase family protein, partial [Planctomycetota bacterium]
MARVHQNRWKRLGWLLNPYILGVLVVYPIGLIGLVSLYSGLGPFQNLPPEQAVKWLPGMWIVTLFLCPILIPMFLNLHDERGMNPEQLVKAILKILGFTAVSLGLSAWVLRGTGAISIAFYFHQFMLAFQLLLVGSFIFFRGLGVGSSASQLFTLALGILMTATVLLSNSAFLILGDEHHRWVIDISIWANPVIVASHAFMELDLFHMQPLYGFSWIPNYHFLYPQWTNVAFIYAATGVSLTVVGSGLRLSLFVIPKHYRKRRQTLAEHRRRAEEDELEPPRPTLGPAEDESPAAQVGADGPEADYHRHLSDAPTPPPGKLIRDGWVETATPAKLAETDEIEPAEGGWVDSEEGEESLLEVEPAAEAGPEAGERGDAEEEPEPGEEPAPEMEPAVGEVPGAEADAAGEPKAEGVIEGEPRAEAEPVPEPETPAEEEPKAEAEGLVEGEPEAEVEGVIEGEHEPEVEGVIEREHEAEVEGV